MSTVSCIPDAVRAEWLLPWDLFEAVTSLRGPDADAWEVALFFEELRAIDPARLANAVRLLRTDLAAGDFRFLECLRTILRRAEVSPYVSEDAFQERIEK